MVITRDYSAASKLVINVRQLGAAGDGVTNDREVIQRVIDDTEDGVVYFPAGVYLIGPPGLVVPASNLHLTGDGIGVSTLLADDLNDLILVQTFDPPGTVSFRNLSFKGEAKRLVSILADDSSIPVARFEDCEFDLPTAACLFAEAAGAVCLSFCILSRAAPAKHLIIQKPLPIDTESHIYLTANIFRDEAQAIIGQDNTLGGGLGEGAVVIHDPEL
jgi:hypothetical protein